MKQYLDTVREILENGTRKENRTGIDTLSTFNINYEIDLRKGFPLLTTKKISWKNIVIENLWFLSGKTHISLLQKHGCKFWDAWANEKGEVPSAYGNFWRNFPIHQNGTAGFIDQVSFVLDELNRNPMSRRLIISAWAPGNALFSNLPPCHAMYVLNVQLDKNGNQYLCLHLTQRSCDVALGIPYNIAGYAFILELFSRFSGIPAGIFAHTLIDAHVYTSKPDGSSAEYDHIPGLKEQLSREKRFLPSINIDSSIKTLDDIRQVITLSTNEIMDLFQIEDYNPWPAINFKVAV